MVKALRYLILRDIEANGNINIPLAEKPVRVATLLNEAKFDEEQLLIHNTTVFLEDQMHDWNWKNGQFRYYTRIAQRADVLVVYSLDDDYTPPAKFCPDTGLPLDQKK